MRFRAKLLKTVKDIDGTPYIKDGVVDCIMDAHKVAWVMDALHLPLSSHEYETYVDDEDYNELLNTAYWEARYE